jgi:hypothetical protein
MNLMKDYIFVLLKFRVVHLKLEFQILSFNIKKKNNEST